MDLSFPLASEAALGKYTISVQQDMAQKTFSVNEYGKTYTAKVRKKHCGYLEKDEGDVAVFIRPFALGEEQTGDVVRIFGTLEVLQSGRVKGCSLSCCSSCSWAL